MHIVNGQNVQTYQVIETAYFPGQANPGTAVHKIMTKRMELAEKNRYTTTCEARIIDIKHVYGYERPANRVLNLLARI